MLLPEYLITGFTTLCICGSIFVMNKHCIKREENDNKKRKYIILTEETYNSMINIQKQPNYQEHDVVKVQSPPNYNEIDTMK